MKSTRVHSLVLLFIFSQLSLPVASTPVDDDDSCQTDDDSSERIHDINATAQAFWAGADIGTVLRAEAIPSRIFYDFDAVTVKDPIKPLGDGGINAFCVETEPGQCLGSTTFPTSGDLLG